MCTVLYGSPSPAPAAGGDAAARYRLPAPATGGSAATREPPPPPPPPPPRRTAGRCGDVAPGPSSMDEMSSGASSSPPGDGRAAPRGAPEGGTTSGRGEISGRPPRALAGDRMGGKADSRLLLPARNGGVRSMVPASARGGAGEAGAGAPAGPVGRPTPDGNESSALSLSPPASVGSVTLPTRVPTSRAAGAAPRPDAPAAVATAPPRVLGTTRRRGGSRRGRASLPLPAPAGAMMSRSMSDSCSASASRVAPSSPAPASCRRDASVRRMTRTGDDAIGGPSGTAGRPPAVAVESPASTTLVVSMEPGPRRRVRGDRVGCGVPRGVRPPVPTPS